MGGGLRPVHHRWPREVTDNEHVGRMLRKLLYLAPGSMTAVVLSGGRIMRLTRLEDGYRYQLTERGKIKRDEVWREWTDKEPDTCPM